MTLADANEVIIFNDPVLERGVRKALNMPEGDITGGDAAGLDWLDLDADQNAPDSELVHDISALRFFVNLVGLKLNFNAVEDISPLAGLNGLRQLWLLGNPVADFSLIGSLTNLESLGFDAGMQDVGFLANLPNLYELCIYCLREVPADLVTLTNLEIFCSPGGEITDISLLSQLPKLSVIDLSWNLVSDLTPLKNLPLTELYLQGNPIADYSPIAAVYPYLLGRDFDYVELLEAQNPDETVSFADPVLEQKIRAAINIPSGPITAADAAGVTALTIANDWQPQIPDEVKVTNLAGMEYFINLRELDASFNGITDVTPLAGLSKLEKLQLGGNAVEDAAPFAQMVSLRHLTLFGSRISDLSPFAETYQLGSLNLNSNPVSDVSPLKNLTGMGSLFLIGCGVEDISPLAGLVNLDCLELSDNYISDLSALSGMDKLLILKLANNPIADYSPIESIYPQLQDKDFELGQTFDVDVPLTPENPDTEVEIGDAVLEAVLRAAAGVYDRPLTQKDLAGIGKFSVDANSGSLIFDISALKYCINLEGFAAYGSGISDLSPLRGLTKLRGLTITNAMLSDLSPLEGMVTLTNLEFSGNWITDISVLRTLPNLQRVDLSYNRIADFSPLYELKQLQMLRINSNATQDASGLKDLAANIQDKDFDPMQPLELDTRVRDGEEPAGDGTQTENPDTVIVFADPVLELRVRKALDRPEGDITAGEAAGITYLNLGNEWQDTFPEGSQFSDLTGLEYFINLKSLDIPWNLVEDIGALAGMTQLEYLHMYGNCITDIAPLAGLTNLVNLNFGGNLVSDISALSGLANLKELYLGDNPIADYSPVETIYTQLSNADFTLP